MDKYVPPITIFCSFHTGKMCLHSLIFKSDSHMLISLKQPELILYFLQEREANNYCMYKLGLYQTVHAMYVIFYDNAAWSLKYDVLIDLMFLLNHSHIKIYDKYNSEPCGRQQHDNNTTKSWTTVISHIQYSCPLQALCASSLHHQKVTPMYTLSAHFRHIVCLCAQIWFF